MPAVLAPLGPNPAAFTELVWALHRDGQRVDEAQVLLESQEAMGFWLGEVLGWALPRLQEEVGPLHPSSRVLDSEDAFAQTLWDMFRDLQERHEAVVVALSGGRWRGSAALTTSVFQLLARPGDRLVDVRVSREAEGGTGFFFPSQPDQELVGVHAMSGRPFRARQVEVRLEPVVVPRLRVVLDEPPERFGDALDRVQRALDARRPATVTVGRQVVVDGQPLRLSPSAVALYGYLASRRQAQAWDVDSLHDYLEGVDLALSGVLAEIRTAPAQGPDDLQRLSQNWSRMRRKVRDELVRLGLPLTACPVQRTTSEGSVWSVDDKLVVR